MVDAAQPDVLAHLELVLVEVLENDAEPPAKLVRVPVAQVAAVEQHAPFGGLVEARDELHERRLSRAVLPHEGEALPRGDLQVDVAKRPDVLARITEADVLEDQARAARGGQAIPVAGAASADGIAVRGDSRARRELRSVGGDAEVLPEV
jgi:hypothetical protein